jgi:hypothetical protein
MSNEVFIEHDDNDGNASEGLHLISGSDGDFFLSINNNPDHLRFRMPIIGGGKNENTWFALRHLFESIKKDNYKNSKQLDLNYETTDIDFEKIKKNKVKDNINNLIDNIEKHNLNSDDIKERLQQIIYYF